MIKVEKVSKIYQSDDVPTYALDKVDLLLPNKGMIFIVGKSGSGKSTLLNVIAGFDKPSEGSVYFGKDKLNDLSPKELDYYRNSIIGFVFQDYCLIETFTVKQNIKMAFDYQNKKTSNCKIEDILESVEMKGFGKHYPRQLSAGQKQRIAIARALAKDSKIILADEPTGNLDSKTSIQILDLLKKISEERLVVIVSHNKEDANKYADRIIEISNGKIVADKVKNLGYENNYSISNKVITLPNRTHLSEEQLTEINKTINEGKGSVLVNRGQDEFIDFNGEINTYNVSTSETHMGFMNMLKYSWLFFKNQFFSFFLVVLTVTILITTLSISIQFANYNGNYQFAEAIKASDTTTLILRQDGEVVVGNDVFVGKHMLPFNQEDGEKLKRKFGYDSYDVYNLYYPVAASSAALYKYKDNALDNRGSVNTLMICDMQYLIDTFKDENNKLNYVGNISENEEGIIITDYIADYLLYSYSQSTYTSYQDIFTNPYLYKVYGVKISAIIDTVYDYESYKDGSFEASYNEADYNDAYDEEDDRDLAERYYLALQNNKTSGNVNHYKSWALEVTGCGYCKVIPLWDKDNGMNGKGSVKLIIANSNKRQASAELIKDVKDHIGAVDGTGEAPIGADVTVISYTEKTVNIDMDVLIDENTTLDIVKENMKKVLENYLNDLDVDATKVRIFDIYKAITKVDGLVDADAIKLNGIESNIDLNDEIPILGTITLKERVI